MRRPAAHLREWHINLIILAGIVLVVLAVVRVPAAALVLPLAAFAWFVYLTRERRWFERVGIALALTAILLATVVWWLTTNGDDTSITPSDQPSRGVEIDPNADYIR